MIVKGVIIETYIPTGELQDESDRVGNGFLHSDTESGDVYIEDPDPVDDGGLLMNLWISSIRGREEDLKERNEI